MSIIENLQNRYIKNKIRMGIATEASCSEPILRPLREKGFIKGLPDAWKKGEEIFGYEFEGKKKIAATTIGLTIGAIQFFLIAGGIGFEDTSEGGNWKWFADFVQRLEEQENKK